MEFSRSFILFSCCLAILYTSVCTASPNSQSRIINSELSYNFRFYARITGYSPDYTTFKRGSGTFISRKHIVTAASLVTDVNQVAVQYGASLLADLRESTFYPEIHVHPGFDPETFANDIAVIVFSVEFDYDYVTPAALFRDATGDEVREGNVVGFGYSPNETRWEENEVLSYFESSWISNENCLNLLGERSELKTSTHYCGMDYMGTATVCHGDIGAGYVKVYFDEFTLIGVLSVFTNMCNPQFPALYTRVSDYVDWIDEITGELK